MIYSARCIPMQYLNSKQPSVHNVEALCRVFHASAQTIRAELASGGIPGAFKVGRRWYVSDENLRRFMNGCSQ